MISLSYLEQKSLYFNREISIRGGFRLDFPLVYLILQKVFIIFSSIVEEEFYIDRDFESLFNIQQKLES